MNVRKSGATQESVEILGILLSSSTLSAVELRKNFRASDATQPIPVDIRDKLVPIDSREIEE